MIGLTLIRALWRKQESMLYIIVKNVKKLKYKAILGSFVNNWLNIWLQWFTYLLRKHKLLLYLVPNRRYFLLWKLWCLYILRAIHIFELSNACFKCRLLIVSNKHQNGDYETLGAFNNYWWLNFLSFVL